MSSGKGIEEFPNVEAKLQKPAKQSAFERQRAEAEAKRKREAAETAAVYADFVKSFDDGYGDDDNNNSHGRGGGGAGRASSFEAHSQRGMHGGGSKRHFGTSALKSGPGSLGPAPASFGKKRSFQDFSKARPSSRDKAAELGFEGRDERAGKSLSGAFDVSDDEDVTEGSGDRAEVKATAKPTMRLWDLPPGSSPAMLKAIVSESLPVESVRLLSASTAGGSERKTAQAIIIFSQETPSSEVDAAVSSLKGRYLGFGYYLSLDRGPSTAVLNSTMQRHNLPSLASSMPFDAKPVEQPASQNQRSTSQRGTHRGFAPPSSYGPAVPEVSRSKLMHVPVKPPQDIRTIQLINKAIEGLLEHGPEFEALLMTRPEVQRDEKWAWIWNARSQGGVWYRWRLWEIITGSAQARIKDRYLPLFEGSHAWKTPSEQLRFEYATKIEDFISDEDYDSSEDDDDDDEAKPDGPGRQEEMTCLNPLKKAKLTHLLARLPPTISKLRKGDIARVTAFAIINASRGAEEIVNLLLANVEQPFSLAGVNGERKETRQAAGTDEVGGGEGPDVGAASLVGLYVVSDILSSSSTTNVRHGWRYRAMLETALQQHKTFEWLGMMAERLGWGRLRADKWKRSIHLVLDLWEGWCSFAVDVHKKLAQTFDAPPSLKAKEPANGDDNDNVEGSKKRKWKLVEAAQDGEAAARKPPADENNSAKSEPTGESDVKDKPMTKDDARSGPTKMEDVKGEPMDEDEVMEGQDVQMPPKKGGGSDGGGDGQGQGLPADELGQNPATTARGQPRKRMRAVDMFADSDGSEGG